jgi:hypothetical protein
MTKIYNEYKSDLLFLLNVVLRNNADHILIDTWELILFPSYRKLIKCKKIQTDICIINNIHWS